MDFLSGIDPNILIGNIISLAACAVMVCIGLIKSKKKIMLVQCLQFALQAMAHFMLGGISGTVGCIVSIARNIVFFKVKSSALLKIIFIAVQIIFSAGALSWNVITWIPVVAVAIFTWYIDTQDIIKFKWVMIITLIMWFVYDAYHLNVISASFDIFTMLSTGYSLWQIKKPKKENG